jgi:homoserine dehydrogenase
LIQGIVNGSTNYILTQIVEQNTSYSNALEKAQNNGFAESNPIMDVCGFDAKYKLLILIAHAYGAVLKSQDILNIGIDQLTDMDFQFAKEKGLKIKLIAHAKKDENDAISAFVMPMFIQSSDKLYSVDNEYNAVKIVSSFSDTQYFFGKGAGSYPTSSAVISDISALTYNYKYEYKKLGSSIGLQKDEMVDLKIYLRCRIDESIELVHHFSEIEENYSNSMHSYTIGLITLKQLKLILNLKKPVSIVLFEALEFQSKVSVNYIEEMQFHEVNN